MSAVQVRLLAYLQHNQNSWDLLGTQIFAIASVAADRKGLLLFSGKVKLPHIFFDCWSTQLPTLGARDLKDSAPLSRPYPQYGYKPSLFLYFCAPITPGRCECRSHFAGSGQQKYGVEYGNSHL